MAYDDSKREALSPAQRDLRSASRNPLPCRVKSRYSNTLATLLCRYNGFGWIMIDGQTEKSPYTVNLFEWEYAEMNPTITKERAEEIWSQRKVCNDISDALTEDEYNIIMAKWKTMSGGSSFMSAFFEFLNGRVQQ